MAEVQATLPLYLTAIGAGTLLLYLVSLAVYRLYLSPIANFPGPKLAALTLWYEFYHDVVRGGQYVFKINELHDQYGMVTSCPRYNKALRDQDQSFGSIRTNYTSAIQTSTMFSTAVRGRNVTSGGGLWRCLATVPPCLEQFLMTFIDFAEVL